ncbi:MAG: galactokinase [Ktedonobacteraceae bacterium]
MTIPQPALQAAEKFPIAFTNVANYTSSLGVAWAPGRVNIIGEHTDYNDGFVLPTAVDRVVAFAVRRRDDSTVRLWSEQFAEHAQFSLEGLPENFELQKDTLPGWARYVLGVTAEMASAALPLSGCDAVLGGDVPIGGGMSSSAALEVATVQLFALLSQGRFTIGTEAATMTPMDVAGLCQRAEHSAAGLRSGILDQAASCLGQPKKAVLIDCRSLEYRYLPFDEPDLSLVVIDTGVRRELAYSGYNERRRQCEEAVVLLRELIAAQEPDGEKQQITSLRDISQEQFDVYKHDLSEVLQRRAGYIIAENARVMQVADLLETGNVEAIGPILWKGHAGLRDEYEVSCKELDALVDIAHSVPGVLGGRMMGGGFGGCTINFVRNEAIEALRQAVEQQYPERTGRQASIDICHAAGGPGYANVNGQP